jgi:2-dehydro-3-deoxyphosphogluconate aldolase/(4S)-4-hydroxy-2-oxoglutarate aldolase
MVTFEELFRGQIMAILRGFTPQETVRLAGIAWDAGIANLEVPIGEPDQVPALEAAVAAGRERGMAVGAGTIVTPEQIDVASRAGAAYTVAPGWSAAVLRASIAAGLPHLPGVATPTELAQALGAGCAWVKAFPAITLGPSWFKVIRGPFPRVRLVATGGITVHTAGEFLAAGADVVAVGSALNDPEQVALLSTMVG